MSTNTQHTINIQLNPSSNARLEPLIKLSRWTFWERSYAQSLINANWCFTMGCHASKSTRTSRAVGSVGPERHVFREKTMTTSADLQAISSKVNGTYWCIDGMSVRLLFEPGKLRQECGRAVSCIITISFKHRRSRAITSAMTWH